MLKSYVKKGLVGLLTLSLIAGMSACSKKDDTGTTTQGTSAQSTTAEQKTTAGNSEATTQPQSDKPDTWIADRTITVQAYVDDIGYALPDDINSTPVMQELTKRTGIKLDIRYTPGDSDSAVLASQLASGTIPDVIVTYLNNSTRPEFTLLYKAAKEEMFADVSPYFANSQVYKNYLADGYLPNDTKNNIMFRDEFGGKVYLIHLNVARVDRSLTFEPEEDFIGGLYIQRRIVEQLGIDPKEIRTQDQFYDLLVQIKNGNFKDLNGNDVVPLGPKYWGGSVDSIEYITQNYHWGVSEEFNMTEDGQILHEAETDYAFKKINFVRKLLDEKLINPEFFTMDSTRAKEVCETLNSGIIADVHNYVDLIYESDNWMKLGPLNDFTGDNAGIKNGKTGYGAWAISAEAENPEEIFKFFDYIATKEGKLLTEYGIEGQHYDMVDGKPVLKPEVLQKINDGDDKYLINEIGAGFGGSGFVFLDYMQTDTDALGDFGESRPGAGSSNLFEGAIKVANENPPHYKLVPGLNAPAFLNMEGLEEVKAQMVMLNYKEMLVQAMFADKDSDVTKIVESFREQLKAAGIDQFKAELMEIYNADPEAISFMIK